ncbi:MAG: ethanolamine ammonia-lyase reactivating factor EutA [Chloroflexota bacterium]
MHDDPFEHGHYGEEMEAVFGSIADDGFPINPDWLRLTSVGIDIGSSTSHLMFSKLIMRRRSTEMSSAFEVVAREVIYRSPILLTPYSDPDTIDADSLGEFVATSYVEAGLEHDDVDTGAVICTGEAVRKHNSEAIIRVLAEKGGKFVCATAGPNLEGILGAHGSGAAERSKKLRAGMNVDMGGGTAKIAIVQNGQVTDSMAINVGARLIAWDKDNVVTRVEEAGRVVARALGHEVKVGQVISEQAKADTADRLAEVLFDAIGRKTYSALSSELLITTPLEYDGPIDEVGFSGGVAEYVYDYAKEDYGDMGPLLGAAVRKRLPSLGIPLAGSAERIRATVIGASQYTVQVSTSTVFVSNLSLLPVLDLQVVPAYLPENPNDLTRETVDAAIAQGFERLDIAHHDLGRAIALAIVGPVIPTYDSIKALCDGIYGALKPLSDHPWSIILSADVAGLVGSMLKQEYDVKQDVIVVDGITVGEFNFVDLGEPIESVEAVPVVVKSLVFEG